MLFLVPFACSTPAPTPAPALPAEAPTPAPASPPARAFPEVAVPAGVRRIVAIGDLHGDRTAAVDVLRLAGLTDEKGSWIAGDAVFVQTGDTTDRGPDSKGVIDLLRALQKDAAGKGGTVVLLNGNHEVMNLPGDWRYVSPEDLAGFGGQLERAAAFSATGEYGSFLASLPVVAKVDDTVFAHGGVTAEFAALGVDGLNERARKHYFDGPGPLGDAVHGDEGPTWYRGYVRDPEKDACPRLEAALTALGARRMVVGHTTQKSGSILSRCDGRLAVIDTGISAHYGGHLAAWESIDGDARARTPAGVVDLPDPR